MSLFLIFGKNVSEKSAVISSVGLDELFQHAGHFPQVGESLLRDDSCGHAFQADVVQRVDLAPGHRLQHLGWFLAIGIA